MAGLNTAQIKDRARERGINLSDSEAQNILDQAWDQGQWGADAGKVSSILGTYGRKTYQTTPNTTSSVDAYLKQQTDLLTQAFKDQQKRVGDYLKNNPFAYDEQWLADTKKQVTDEIELEPYYKEKLSNYLQDVETTKERAQGDEQTLLKELDRQKSVYMKQDKISFQRQRELALEGLSDKGLLDTGSGQRELNRGDISHNVGVEDYLSKQDLRAQQAQQTTSRLLSDLGTDTERFTTDLEREKQLNIQSEIQNRKQEKYNYWDAGFKKAQGAIAPGYNMYLG